jgi:hypothetical protein
MSENAMDSTSPEGSVDERGMDAWSEQLNNLELLEQGCLGQLIEFQVIVEQYLLDQEF